MQDFDDLVWTPEKGRRIPKLPSLKRSNATVSSSASSQPSARRRIEPEHIALPPPNPDAVSFAASSVAGVAGQLTPVSMRHLIMHPFPCMTFLRYTAGTPPCFQCPQCQVVFETLYFQRLK